MKGVMAAQKKTPLNGGQNSSSSSSSLWDFDRALW